MKLQFSATQDYQLEAVKSVIDIFEGQPLAKGDFEISFAMEGASIAYTENGIGNNLVLTESQILQNIQTIQARNNIVISENLVSSYSEDQKTEYNRLNFTIEMETGTGKTYTFLRTIYELNKVYGFKKFVIVVVASIKRNLNALLVAGIRYEQINGQKYEMQLFQLEEIDTYLENLFAVTKIDKTLFNYIQVDSTIESDFARDCEADEKVKFFFKLPKAFKIPTPIGNYTPDWAVILEQDHRIYFVAETKGTLDHQALRELEKMKINCGEKHFALFEPLGVKYQLAVTTRDLY
jgi:restriction endonuclease